MLDTSDRAVPAALPPTHHPVSGAAADRVGVDRIGETRVKPRRVKKAAAAPEVIFRSEAGYPDITAKVLKPGRALPTSRPTAHIEQGCNELWLDAAEARAVIRYLMRTMPELERK
jgi:hypothetical protein